VSELSSTTGAVAIAGVVLALIAVGLVVWALLRQRKILAGQRAVLGRHGPRDLIAHAEELESGYEALHAYVEDVARRLEGRVDHAERGVSGSLSLRALLRYDAYDELSGHQSTTIALLDETRSGIVLSSVHHRDQARLYVRKLDRGTPDVPLTPEEEEAVRRAVASGNPGREPGHATPGSPPLPEDERRPPEEYA
jgi:hypothetical protein